MLNLHRMLYTSIWTLGLTLATGCLSWGNENIDENAGTVGAPQAKPATIDPDECVGYVQEKRDSDYVCELADGTTRPLRTGERRSTPLARDEIVQVVSNYSDDVAECMEPARKANPKAEGKIYISFTIEADGVVSEAAWAQDRSTFKNETLGKCLAGKIKKWRFPVLRADETLVINFPFWIQNPESPAETPASSPSPAP